MPVQIEMRDRSIQKGPELYRVYICSAFYIIYRVQQFIFPLVSRTMVYLLMSGVYDGYMLCYVEY